MIYIFQRITPEMLSELTQEQKERLREWWKPQENDVFMAKIYGAKDEWDFCVYEVKANGKITAALEPYDGHTEFEKSECLPLLSVGQCIQLLKDHCNEIAIGFNDSGCFWHVHIGPRGTGNMLDGFGEQHAEPDTGELIIPLWSAVKAVL